MCKIWLESILPLRICVKKTLSVYFLLTYLSVLYFVGATDHSFVAILMLNGSNNVFRNH